MSNDPVDRLLVALMIGGIGFAVILYIYCIFSLLYQVMSGPSWPLAGALFFGACLIYGLIISVKK
jgi:hypothetical protein